LKGEPLIIAVEKPITPLLVGGIGGDCLRKVVELVSDDGSGRVLGQRGFSRNVRFHCG